MGRQDDERDENSEEAQDVQDQNQALELGQRRGHDGVDEDGEQDDGPVEQGAVPRLRCVVVVCGRHGDHTPEHVACQEAARSHRALPSADSEPPCQVAKELGARARRQHGRPVVLAAGRGRHGDQLRERREDGDVAKPDDDVAVDDALPDRR
ncbi:hypothetical protein J3459_018631 [Metarhizium acridum]|nr:hypothetical protein J3459_018631 [Metarhizium acridum]